MDKIITNEILFFGKKINKKNIENRILFKILNELTEEDNKYRFYSDDGHSDYSEHSDHYSDYSDYSDSH